jgi:hypothetical protein
MTARKTLVGTGFEGERPDPEERKVPDRFGHPPKDEPAPAHDGVTGEPPAAPDSKDSRPRGPKSNG